ncbi:MAG: hypothetical protein Q9169_008707, partial [Polycauliona sp. 2 TL-2023]
MHRIQHGNHTFLNCRTQSRGIIAQLHALSTNIAPALLDLNNPHSSPAFNAFFQDPKNAPYIQRVLQNVTTGAPLTTINGTRISPSFVCIDGPGQVNFTRGNETMDVYTECSSTTSSELYAGATTQSITTPLIILCPRFFNVRTRLPSTTTPPRGCLRLGPQARRFQ